MNEKKTKRIKYPVHKMGKDCGYEEYEDGSIQVAGTYWQPMNDALDSGDAVDALLKAITEQCHQLMIPIVKAREHFWSGIKEDYGLDTDKCEFSYNKHTHIVSRKLKETKP